jgi:hypothetical protein
MASTMIYIHNYIVMTGAQALTTYPAGSGPIYLDNVACSGSELTLAQCTYDSHTEDCQHVEDAGVRCARKYIILEVLIGSMFTIIIMLWVINDNHVRVTLHYSAHKMHGGQLTGNNNMLSLVTNFGYLYAMNTHPKLLMELRLIVSTIIYSCVCGGFSEATGRFQLE